MLSTHDARSAADAREVPKVPFLRPLSTPTRRIGRDESDLAEPCFPARCSSASSRGGKYAAGIRSDAIPKVVSRRGPTALSPAAAAGKGGLDGLTAEPRALRPT